MVLAAVVLLAAAVNFPGKFLGMIRVPFVLLLLFTAAVSLSAVVAVSPALAWPPTWQFLRVILMSMSIALLLESTSDLRWLVLAMGYSVAGFGFKFGFFGVFHPGVRYAYGYGGMIGDNNGMALDFAMGIPLVWYGIDLMQSRPIRLALYLITFLNVAAVALTYSRGGALALGFGMLLIGVRARHKLLTIAVVVIAGVSVAESPGPSTSIASRPFSSRRRKLRGVPHRAGSDRVENLVELPGHGRRLWSHQPATAHAGLRPERGVFHQSATQYLGSDDRQHRTGRLYVYCALIFGSLLWLGGSIRQTRKWKREYLAYPLALQTSLVVFAVGSTFLSVTGYDFLYYLLMAIAVWYRVYHREVVPLRDKQHHAIAFPTFRSPLRRNAPIRLGAPST